MLKKLLPLLVGAFLCFCVFGLSYAENPHDGLCADLEGAAFGLCNSAVQKGCGTDAEQNSQACDSIEKNYFKTTGEILPWFVACPCWNQAQLDKVFTIAGYDYDYDFCAQVDHSSGDETTYIYDYGDSLIEDNGESYFDHHEIYAVSVNFIGPREDSVDSCSYQETEAVGGQLVTEIIVVMPVTSEQHTACTNQVLARAAAAGITCGVYNF